MSEFKEHEEGQLTPAELAEALISEWAGSQRELHELAKTPTGESMDAKDAAEEYFHSKMIDAEIDFTNVWVEVPDEQKEATVEELLKRNDAGAISALAERDLSGISKGMQERLRQAAKGFESKREE